MAKLRQRINSFSSGEITSRLTGRSDLEYFSSACNEITNMYVHVHGGSNKRPGTLYVATAGDYNNEVRTIPFKFSTTQAYIIEMGHSYMRFYMDGGQIYDGGTGLPYEIATVYSGTDLFDIKFAQTADTMYFAHPDYHPQVLTRTGHADWTIADVAFVGGPFLDENTDTNIELTPTDTTGDIGITSTSGIFDPLHVGAYWQFKGDISESKNCNSGDDWTESITLDSGETLVWSVGGSSWNMTVRLQKSYDEGSTWIDDKFATANGSIEVPSLEDNVYYRAGVKSGEHTSGTSTTTITKRNATGYVEITTYVSDTSVSGTVIEDLPSTDATYTWSEGAWSDYRGYPSAVTFSSSRLIFASTDHQPQTYWGSVVDDYINFDVGTGQSDDAFAFTIVSSDVNTIRWLADTRQLIGGSSSAEWVLSKDDTTLTPSSPYVRRQSSHGSANLQAKQVGYQILFFQEGPYKLRSMEYDFGIDGHVSQDISLRAEHLFRNRTVVDWAYAEQPDYLLLMVMDDGDIVVCAYEASTNTVSFSEWETDGDFESIAVIPGDDRDEIWVVAKRTTSTYGDLRMIEQFSSPNWTEITDYKYMDSCISYTGTPKTTISGLDHLDGATTTCLVDGAVHPNVTVSGGVTELQQYYEGTGSSATVHFGRPYTATLQTTRLEPQTELGTSWGQPQCVYELNILLENSIGLKLGINSDDLETVKRFNAPTMNEGQTPYSGIFNKTFPGGWETELTITLVNDQPLPFYVKGIAYTIGANAR